MKNPERYFYVGVIGSLVAIAILAVSIFVFDHVFVGFAAVCLIANLLVGHAMWDDLQEYRKARLKRIRTMLLHKFLRTTMVYLAVVLANDALLIRWYIRHGFS
jgi:hypothetical protein